VVYFGFVCRRRRAPKFVLGLRFEPPLLSRTRASALSLNVEDFFGRLACHDCLSSSRSSCRVFRQALSQPQCPSPHRTWRSATTFESDGQSRVGPSAQRTRTGPRRMRHGTQNERRLGCSRAGSQGPLFAAEELSGVILLDGESVLANKRVARRDDIVAPTQGDEQGWVHNFGREGESLMIPHSLQHQVASGRSTKPGKDGCKDVPRNGSLPDSFTETLLMTAPRTRKALDASSRAI